MTTKHTALPLDLHNDRNPILQGPRAGLGCAMALQESQAWREGEGDQLSRHTVALEGWTPGLQIITFPAVQEAKSVSSGRNGEEINKKLSIHDVLWLIVFVCVCVWWLCIS